MLLAQLQKIATDSGISGAGRMRKSELVAAITQHQSGGAAAAKPSQPRRAATSRNASPKTDQAELPVGEATMSDNATDHNAAESVIDKTTADKNTETKSAD